MCAAPAARSALAASTASAPYTLSDEHRHASVVPEALKALTRAARSVFTSPIGRGRSGAEGEGPGDGLRPSSKGESPSPDTFGVDLSPPGRGEESAKPSLVAASMPPASKT